jgi:hypothetical protein
VRFCALLVTVLAALARAHASDILDARYDPGADELVVDIAYRGTNPDHEFSVAWGPCSDASPARTVGRLIDQQGSDLAREDYRVSERLALEEIPCRPAIVTLRLGRVAHIDVYVPIRNKPRALGADTVMSAAERTREDRLPARDAGEAQLLGNAYPGPVREVHGIAIRYLTKEDS